MLDIKDNLILDVPKIKLLNKTLGATKLDESGNTTYIVKFAFNDQKNQATDPIPFRIATEALDKIADTGIGRPYVFNPGIKNNVGEHVRGAVDDPKKIVEFQKKFALGIIDATYRNESNNVYAIINTMPEYFDEITSGKIPLPTSPLLEPLSMKGDTIYDANWLHLQAVKSSGYPMELTSQLGVCKGMLDKCSTELRTLGASRKLKEFQRNFSYTESTLGGTEMPAPDDTTTGPQGNGSMSVDDMVKKHEQMLSDHNKTIGAIGETLKDHGNKLDAVLKAVSDKTGDSYPGTDSSKGQTTGSGSGPGMSGYGAKSLGSAGQQTEMVQIPKKEFEELQSGFKTVKTEFEKLQTEMTEKEKQLALKDREEMAKIIASGEVVIKEITPDKFNDRVKYYVELTNEDKTPVDLTLLASKFKKFGKTLGSFKTSESVEDKLFEMDSTLGASGAKEEPLSVTDIFSEIVS